MYKINRIVAFTGNKDVKLAIAKRIRYTARYVKTHGLALHKKNPCAIFRPEAGMHKFEITCDFDGLICSKNICKDYALLVDLTGTKDAVDGFCQALCDLSGMTCYAILDTGAGYESKLVAAPCGTPKSHNEFIKLLFDAVEE